MMNRLDCINLPNVPMPSLFKVFFALFLFSYYCFLIIVFLFLFSYFCFFFGGCFSFLFFPLKSTIIYVEAND